MAGRIDFRKIETPTEFQQLCERLLARIFPGFHPVNQAGGDAGVDGFATWGEEYFQFTHPKGNVALKKFCGDLEKMKRFQGLKKWHFLCSQSLSIKTWEFLEGQRGLCPFDIRIWDGARLKEELSKHSDLVDEFFPEFAKKAYEGTRDIRKDLGGLKRTLTRVRKKPPRQGDAPEGLAIDENERQDIRDLILQLAEEEARRRKRKDPGPHIGSEWGEFNRYFDLSSYDRLPSAKFEEGIGYLRDKLFARRNNEPQYLKIKRDRNGIHGIAASLGWSEDQRHRFYCDLTGKDRLTKMSRQEIHKVFVAMRLLQDAAG